MNPYYGTDGWEFLQVLAGRLWGFACGRPMELASDELQMLVLVLVAISGALVGSLLVLRRMAMMANSLSHTILPGVVLAYLAHRWLVGGNAHDLLPSEAALMGAALCMALITTVCTQWLVRTAGLAEDAATAVVFTGLFSAGVVLVTAVSRNAHVGAELLMGNVDALHRHDLTGVFWITVVDLVVIGGGLRAFWVTTFDPVFARVVGVRSGIIGYVLMALVAVTCVAAFRAVGVLMVIAFLVGPPLVARLWTKRLHAMLGVAVGVGMACGAGAVVVARHVLTVSGVALSTGGIAVALIGAAFGVSALCRITYSGILHRAR